MKRFGLTEARYNQLMNKYDNDIETVEEIATGWGKDANNGYAIMDFDGTGMLEVNRIDEIMAFDSDDDAVEQAVKDGIKIIPVDELPKDFDRRYFGWIDTPENRSTISTYTEKYCSINK